MQSWPIKANVLCNEVRNCVFLKTITTRSSCFIMGAQERVRATTLNGPMYYNESREGVRLPDRGQSA